MVRVLGFKASRFRFKVHLSIVAIKYPDHDLLGSEPYCWIRIRNYLTRRIMRLRRIKAFKDTFHV